MDPKFSVIIPAYNSARYIGKAIDSALAQETPAHEIVVVDDGSTDGTPALLASYGARIKTQRIPNSGASAARNAAIRMATGDHLAFLDADDAWFKNKLRVVSEYIRKYPEIGFFASDHIIRYRHLGNRLFKHYSTLDNRRRLTLGKPMKELPFRLFLYSNFVSTPSGVVARKDIIERAGLFIEGLRYVEDFDMWFRASTQTNFLLIDQVLFYKRTHPENISVDTLSTYFYHREVLIRMLSNYREYIKGHGLDAESRLALAKMDYRLGNLFFNAGKHRVAFALYREGLGRTAHPSNLVRYSQTVLKKYVRILKERV